jgi:hypothetical protein
MSTLTISGTRSPQELLTLIEEHVYKFNALATFAQVDAWDNIAITYVRHLQKMCKEFEDHIQVLTKEHLKADASHRSKSLLRRVFSTSPAAEIQKEIDGIKEFIENAWNVMDTIQSKIDFSPNNLQSSKEGLRELRLRKKALQLEKRQATQNMQAIRLDARQRSVGAAYSSTAFWMGRKGAALQRQSIRYAKEQAVAPHEQNKARIDWEISEIDKMILWIEHIH